jgi:hypothetical protein
MGKTTRCSDMLSLDEIDRLLASTKVVAGQPNWREDPNSDGRALLVITLLLDGITVRGLEVRGNATIRTQRQSVSLLLIADGDPIQRLSFQPKAQHVNSLRATLPRELRGSRLPAGVTRYYPWEFNRRWPRQRQPRERYDAYVEPDLTDLDAAMMFFLERCNIVGSIPPPPHRPELF